MSYFHGTCRRRREEQKWGAAVGHSGLPSAQTVVTLVGGQVQEREVKGANSRSA